MQNWELIAKFLANETTDEENKSVEDWLKSDPENAGILADLKKAMRPSVDKMPDFSSTLRGDWTVLENRIQAVEPERKSRFLLSPTLIYKVAASILLLAVLGMGTWLVFKSSADQLVFTATDSVKQEYLSDRSQVWLNKHSKLSIASDFSGAERNVSLEGEAYFEVSKDTSKPFIITTGIIKTQVVGTAFNVHFEKDGSVKVTVTEGKVSVSMDSGQRIFLTPGEVGFYNSTNGSLSKQNNMDLNFLSWKTGVIHFESATLKDVCEYLSRYYDVEIRIGNTAIADRMITTVLDNMNVEEALEIIASTLELEANNQGNHYIFLENNDESNQ
jgi:transmembrane sensor